MLAIRMQRVGRRGHAQFRMVVQDSHFHPSSGRVVAYLGNYDPHSKESNFDKEKLESYLAKGAQPSPRVVKLLRQEKIKIPSWVKETAPRKKTVRNPEKRRSTRLPADLSSEALAKEEASAKAEASAKEGPAEAEAPAEKPAEPKVEEPVEEIAEAEPTEEKSAE